jgi:hypothetical protein
VSAGGSGKKRGRKPASSALLPTDPEEADGAPQRDEEEDGDEGDQDEGDEEQLSEQEAADSKALRITLPSSYLKKPPKDL